MHPSSSTVTPAPQQAIRVFFKSTAALSQPTTMVMAESLLLPRPSAFLVVGAAGHIVIVLQFVVQLQDGDGGSRHLQEVT